MQTQTMQMAKTERKRKFLLVLPVIILPFMTFLLWSLGLIGTTGTKAQGSREGGLNTQLPDANLKGEKELDKFGIYRQADKDSAKYKEALKRDPYFGIRQSDTVRQSSSIKKGSYAASYDPAPSTKRYSDPNEERITRKLEELNKALSEPPAARSNIKPDYGMSRSVSNSSINSMDVDRLEKMLQMVAQKDSSADPEMQQLNQMMDKLLDLQHPERAEEKLKQLSEQHKKLVYPVTPTQAENISLLQSKQVRRHADIINTSDTINRIVNTSNQFYSLDELNNPSDMNSIISATIAETQTIVSGATVKMQLMGEVYIGGILIPKETFVYGKASLNGERLQVNITTVRFGNNLLPVDLTVYDLDGIQGIYIPGAISRDVMKQSGDEAVRSIGITSIDPSIGAQAAGAGIEAAKNLLGKKIKLVKVTVKEGYQVLLRDNHQK